ncbi:phoenix [Hippoglossus hippoglossus]|uniref:phoenix n=1 Tax=Hippoglossus hippoglossus TaxID=8267 RepID=UPI00148BE334|nr:phoenix [Hippoglossus hippoglossus]
MKRVRKILEFTQSAGFVEAPSPESCHLALETSPPDYVKEISRYLAGQNTQVSNDPAEEESDSGDSLFITQKPAPEAERSRRRKRSNSLRSQPASIRQLEEEDSSSSSSSEGESKTGKGKSGTRRKRVTLPQYSFPFLSEKRPSSALLSARHNTALHYHAMGGFFKCVKELQQGRHGGDDLPSSLPTVDVEGGSISPLSEDEEEGSESMDIKVVERKRFVFVPSKTKHSQPQKTPETRGSNVNHHERNASKGQEASQGRQKTMQHQIPAKALISMSTGLLSNTEDSDGEVPSQSILAHSETPTRKRYLTTGNQKYIQGKESEKELCDDSDATYCDTLELQGSPRLQDTVKDREASLNVTEPPADVFIADDLSQMEQAENQPESKSLPQSLPEAVSGTDNESVCNETWVKKKGKGDDERRGQSQEDPGGLHAARSVEVEAGETPSPTEDNRAEPPATQTCDELENLSHDDVIARQEERHIPESQPSLTCNVVNGGEEKKKKRKKGKRGVDDDEQLKASVVSEPLKDDGEILTKKKKGKKEKIVNVEEHGEALNMTSDLPLRSGGQLEETGDCLENIESTQEKLEPILEKKRKKHEKKRPSADQEDTEVGAKDDANSSLSNDVTTETSTVKKKKIKEKKRESTSEGLDISCISEVDDANHSQKMKGGSDDRALESVMKKKKKRESTSEGVDVSCTFNQNEKVDDADHSHKTKEGSDDKDAEPLTKKKKKTKKRESTSEGVDVYCTPNKKEKVDDADPSQKTKEDSDDRDAESVTKKKKKKKSEILSRAVSEDAVAQSHDSVSVRKKKRTSSFLVADAEEKEAQTHEEQSSPCSNSAAAKKPGVSAGAPETESAETAGNVEESNNGARKKKKKRKVSEVEESVQKYREQDFEEPNETCESPLPDATETRVKRKKKSKRNESELVTAEERLESADDAGYSQTDEAVVLRKKKSKKCKSEPDHVIQESLTPATDSVVSGGAPVKTCSSVSLKKKGKQSAGKESCGHSAEETRDVSAKTRKETLNVPHNVSPSAQTPGVISEAVRVKKNKKSKRAKTKLYDPSEDLYTDQ